MNRATFMRETHLASNPVGHPATAGSDACNVPAAAAHPLSQINVASPGPHGKPFSARLTPGRRAPSVGRYFVAAIIPRCCGSQIDSGGQ